MSVHKLRLHSISPQVFPGMQRQKCGKRHCEVKSLCSRDKAAVMSASHWQTQNAEYHFDTWTRTSYPWFYDIWCTWPFRKISISINSESEHTVTNTNSLFRLHKASYSVWKCTYTYTHHCFNGTQKHLIAILT